MSGVRLSKEPWSRGELRWAKGLFLRAFPPEERPPFWVMRRRAKAGVDWWKVLDGGKLAGFLYVLANAELAYVFHFAIHEDFRGRGVGSAAIRELMRAYGDRRLFLAIERIEDGAPNLPERVRRRNFYLRCGMRDMHQRVQEGEVVYDLLGTGGRVEDAEYQALIRPWMAWPFAGRVTMKVLD